MAVVYDEGYEKPTRIFSFKDTIDDFHFIDFTLIYRISIHENYTSDSSDVSIFWNFKITGLIKTEFKTSKDSAKKIANAWCMYINGGN